MINLFKKIRQVWNDRVDEALLKKHPDLWVSRIHVVTLLIPVAILLLGPWPHAELDLGALDIDNELLGTLIVMAYPIFAWIRFQYLHSHLLSTNLQLIKLFLINTFISGVFTCFFIFPTVITSNHVENAIAGRNLNRDATILTLALMNDTVLNNARSLANSLRATQTQIRNENQFSKLFHYDSSNNLGLDTLILAHLLVTQPPLKIDSIRRSGQEISDFYSLGPISNRSLSEMKTIIENGPAYIKSKIWEKENRSFITPLIFFFSGILGLFTTMIFLKPSVLTIFSVVIYFAITDRAQALMAFIFESQSLNMSEAAKVGLLNSVTVLLLSATPIIIVCRRHIQQTKVANISFLFLPYSFIFFFALTYFPFETTFGTSLLMRVLVAIVPMLLLVLFLLKYSKYRLLPGSTP